MPALLRGAAGLVLSSRSHEFSPFSVLEAMGAGVPVVATRSGGVPELIGAERCVPLGDAERAGRAHARALERPAAAPRGGRAAARRARERHSEERYLADLLAIYESSLSTTAQ